MSMDDRLSNSDISEIKTQIYSAKDDYKNNILSQTNDGVDIDSQILELQKTLDLAQVEVTAKQASYNFVVGGLTGNLEIISPRPGVVSNILKKPGEFVSPGMPIAVVTANNKSDQIVRIHIPNNIKKPNVGETLTVTRPGYGQDEKKLKIIGIGSSLDDTGSYSADAVLESSTDWPIGVSLRILAPINSSAISIKLTSLFWDENGIPKIWLISKAGRIYSQAVKIGRTIGTDVEISEGLKDRDMYIINPTSEVKENILIEDIKGPDIQTGGESSYEKMMKAMGM